VSTYPVTSIPLAPIAGLHGGTGTFATTSWVVEPASVPGSGLLDFTGKDVSVRTFLFEIAANVVPNWFGVAVPTGLTGFGNVHVFFHPTPAQAGYHDADYAAKAGRWPDLFYYMERLGNQLSGAERDQLLVMPFLTNAATDAGILPGHWEEILSDIATAVRDAVAGPDPTPVAVDKVVVSSFSAGIIYSDSFRRRAPGLVPVLAEVWDLDGNASSFHSISVALRATAGCPVTRYDQSGGGDPQTFHVPQPRWASFVQPPQNFDDVHAMIRDFMFLHGAAVTTVGDVIAPPDSGTTTHTATGTATSSATGTATSTATHTSTTSGTNTATHTSTTSGTNTATHTGTSTSTFVGSGTASSAVSPPVPASPPPAPSSPAPAPVTPTPAAPAPVARGPVPSPPHQQPVPARPLGNCCPAAVVAISADAASIATTAHTAVVAIAAAARHRRRTSGR